jgi:two-component sensor histidine kinase
MGVGPSGAIGGASVFEQEAPQLPATAARSGSRTIPGLGAVAILAVAGVGLTSAGFFATRAVERHSVTSEFNRLADDRLATVRRTMADYLQSLLAISAFYDASMEVERNEFTAFTSLLLAWNSGIQALEWVPRVEHERRTAIEQAAHYAGLDGFRISDRDANGDLVPSPARAEYFPVYFVEPFAGNEQALGFDLSSDPIRLSALNRARDTGQMAVTARVRLVQETGDQFAALVFLPKYRKDASPRTEAERREALAGFVVGAFRLGEMLTTTLESRDAEGIEVWLKDVSAPQEQQLLAARLAPRSESAQQPEQVPPDDASSPLYRAARLPIGEQEWEAACTAAPDFMRANARVGAWWVFGGGLVLTSLLCGYVVLLVGRTEELRQANALLAAEIARRTEAEYRQKLTMDELDHRVKNNLAAVLAIAQQTLGTAPSLGAFGQTFVGRIHAMAAVHRALAAGGWEGAELSEIIQLALGAYFDDESSRVTAGGARVQVPARASVPLCMALHELTTNAQKHGALSSLDGHVDVKWSCDDHRMLHLEWTERGGPPVEQASPPGFGTVLIKDVIEHELQGTVDLDCRPQGLVCTMTVPLVDAEQSSSADRGAS